MDATKPRCKLSERQVRSRRPNIQLKPICVQLMGIATQTPTTTSPHAALINSIRSVAETLPDDAFVPSLLNYILFPLTTTLRQAASPGTLPESFLEAAFRLLTLVVHHWRQAPGGMDIGAWEQLWRFTVAAVAPRVGGKGKAKEAGQDMLLDALALLSALLEPRSDTTTPHPTPAMRKMVMDAKSPLMPTLFQTITLSVDCASPHPPNLQLQRTAVQLIRTLVTYIAGQSEILASVLPGVVSALTRAITSGGIHLKGDVAADISAAITEVVTETLDDATLRRLGVLKPIINDLSGLAEEWDRSTTDTSSAPQPHATRGNPFPPLTSAYLEFTSQQLQTTIPPVLLTLAGHVSDLARIAAADMAYSLIQQCHDSLPRLTPPALSTLLVLSRDDFEPVQDVAVHKLHQLLGDKTLPNLDTALVDLLSSAINSLPRLIRSEQDQKVHDAARLVSAIAKVTLLTQHGTRPNAIAYLLGPGGDVARWAWSLLDCLEFGRPRGWSTSAANMSARTAELGWGSHLMTSSLPLLIEAGDGTDTKMPSDTKFPHLPLRYVETDRTARGLADMLEALGAAGGESALFSVDYFIRFAKAHRAKETSKAVSAVWVAQLLLQGAASRDEQPTKPVRKMAREVVRALVAMDEDEEDDEEWEDKEEETSDALLPVERTKGLDQLTTLLDTTPRNHKSASAETRRLHARAQRVLLNALSLSTLATCAHILGTSFRPLLLHALYEILAYLSSPHDLLQQYAETALVRIAYDSGYASARNLVLDNVDYVVNVVSQRLTYHRLSPHAPLVLIAMIRLVGSDIVPMVHDVVDEIFDALDDFHGYSALASALLAVLTTLIDVMADETEAAGPTPERAAAKEEAKRFLAPPDPAADFAKFTTWYNERSAMAQAEVENILDRGPQKPPGVLGEGEEGEEDEKMDEDEAQKDEEIPPTRSQEVAAQILEKATFYLSHASPFLRARVLGIIARAVPILAQSGRESDLLPVIDKAWPIILARLDDPMPYVVVEAAEVIAALAEYVGDYISRRVADAWPRLLRLLNVQTELDRNSALARRGAPGTTSEHTISHRLHSALLRTATFMVSEVPVSEEVIWEILLAFRPLLDRRTHEDLQARARQLYLALGRRDGDAVWVGLRATIGTLQNDKVWGYLRSGLDIETNVAAVLASI